MTDSLTERRLTDVEDRANQLYDNGQVQCPAHESPLERALHSMLTQTAAS